MEQTVSQQDIKAEVESIGWEFLAARPISYHPADWYLHIVLAARPNRTEYTTWIYNASLGGLHGGRYTVSLEQAEKDYAYR
jgi:hypothetical protein